MALINQGKDDIIYIEEGHGETYSNHTFVDGIYYNFYYGDITVKVEDNFNNLSVGMLIGGNEGTLEIDENLLVYDRGLIGYAKILQDDSNTPTSKKYNELSEGNNELLYSQFYAGHDGNDFTIFTDAEGHPTQPSNRQTKLYCLLEDSLIKTPEGDVKVQLLKKGDYVLNEQNKPKKIVNIYNTKREVDITKKKRDFCVDKYLIKKDLIKEGVPSQDLIVSGGHMVKLGDEYHLPI